MKKFKRPEIMVRKERIYLAYGSNLCKRDMAIRCPDARPRGSMMIDNGRLVFRGVADVMPAMGFRVPVGVWSISPKDEETLDRYEGVRAGFYDKEELTLPSGQTALIYMMPNDGIYPPPEGYVNVIRQGYRDFGLDEKYLDAAIFHSFKKKEEDDLTRARRDRQRASINRKRLVKMTDDFAYRRLEAAAKRRREMRTDV